LSKSTFTQIFSHRSPALAAQFRRDSDETPTVSPVTHLLGSAPSQAGLSFLSSLGNDAPIAGCIYYATPEPPFNILRPIAKGFNALLDRIANDIPAFLRLVRVAVSRRGVDGQNYGLIPIAYELGSPERAT